jgi:NADPH:quinone reductase-like Zn-dependent oxidoreductase
MRALTLVADRKIELADVPEPPPPQAGEVQIRVKAVGLNHLDLWGFRGMAFAKRKLPLVVGAEASGEIAAVGPEVTAFKPASRSSCTARSPAGSARRAAQAATTCAKPSRASSAFTSTASPGISLPCRPGS